MKTIAVLYSGGKYLERLVLALQRHLPEGYAAAGFTTFKEFTAWEEHSRVKAVLLSPGCGTSEEMTEIIGELSARRIPVWTLTEDETLCEEPGQMFLYQPVNRFLERLREVFAPTATCVRENSEEFSAQCRCIGVLSLSGESSTACALQLARRQAVNGKTLLLCVNPWPDGTKDWKPALSDVSELIYLLKEHGADWYRSEKCCLQTSGTIRAVSGYSCLSDYGQFTEEDVGALLAGLEAAGYRFLVLDFGAVPQPSLADYCEELYVVGENAGNRYSALERMLREEGLGERLCSAKAMGAMG